MVVWRRCGARWLSTTSHGWAIAAQWRTEVGGGGRCVRVGGSGGSREECPTPPLSVYSLPHGHAGGGRGMPTGGGGMQVGGVQFTRTMLLVVTTGTTR